MDLGSCYKVLDDGTKQKLTCAAPATKPAGNCQIWACLDVFFGNLHNTGKESKKLVV